MLLKRTSAAASPVSLLDAREHLRVTGSDEDMLIFRLLEASVGAISERVGRSLGAETWAMSLAGASGDINLPYPPVQSVTSIEYFDTGDLPQTAALSDFYLFSGDDRTTLRPKPGKAWPNTATREDAVTITFVAGYNTIPAPLRTAVLLMTGHLFENREAVAVGVSVAELPLGVESLVSLYRRGWVAA